MKQPYVSIVIPAFNAASTLGQTIEACRKQDYPGDRLEIIIVDDGSLDNTKEIVAGFNIKYILQKRSGPAAARNNGWRNSKGDAICFTDADCIPEIDWVSKLVSHYDAKNIGAITGSYSVHGSPYLLDKFVHYEIQDRHSRMPEYISSFGTYNVMIKRAVLEVTDGFNPEYDSASGEDTDLSYRIRGAGYRIYFAKDALVSHKNILRVWKYFLVQFRHGYWRMKLYKKNASMISGDEYGYWKDFLELSLGVLSLPFLALGFKNSLIISIVLACIIFFIQLPLVVKIVFYEKNIFYITFSFISFLRVFVRITGGIFGFIEFWILRMG